MTYLSADELNNPSTENVFLQSHVIYACTSNLLSCQSKSLKQFLSWMGSKT